jgi:hypothetical protein
MGTSVNFEVDVSQIEEHFGLTLAVMEEGEEEDSGPCFFLVFKGPQSRDPMSVAQAFGVCHKAAMESVRLEGQLTEEDFESRLEDSIEIASELMISHGYEACVVREVDPSLLEALFSEVEFEGMDPSLAN